MSPKYDDGVWGKFANQRLEPKSADDQALLARYRELRAQGVNSSDELGKIIARLRVVAADPALTQAVGSGAGLPPASPERPARPATPVPPAPGVPPVTGQNAGGAQGGGAQGGQPGQGGGAPAQPAPVAAPQGGGAGAPEAAPAPSGVEIPEPPMGLSNMKGYLDGQLAPLLQSTDPKYAMIKTQLTKLSETLSDPSKVAALSEEQTNAIRTSLSAMREIMELQRTQQTVDAEVILARTQSLVTAMDLVDQAVFAYQQRQLELQRQTGSTQAEVARSGREASADQAYVTLSRIPYGQLQEMYRTGQLKPQEMNAYWQIMREKEQAEMEARQSRSNPQWRRDAGESDVLDMTHTDYMNARRSGSITMGQALAGSDMERRIQENDTGRDWSRVDQRRARTEMGVANIQDLRRKAEEARATADALKGGLDTLKDLLKF